MLLQKENQIEKRIRKQKSGSWLLPTPGLLLFDFLFQTNKDFRMEELINRDTQSIAQLFDGGNGSTVISTADNIVHSGLCHTAHAAEFVE